MLEVLIWSTAAICAAMLVLGWRLYTDVFHPLVLTAPMLAFMYVVMPLQLLEDGALYAYVSRSQAEFAQLLFLLGVAAFGLGCAAGSAARAKPRWTISQYDPRLIRRGGYLLGALGLAAWVYMVVNAGGFTTVFSRPKGYGWSEWGAVRESAYLLIAGLLLLLSPEGFDRRNAKWRLAVVAFSAPYLIQGLLGAQRGPTFLIVATLGLSWYMARGRRPPLTLVLGGGAALAFAMLFLVLNRGEIYLGSDFEVKTDVSEFFQASEANEYIFGVGCITAARQNGEYFWGKRYLAQVLVRPIPRQIWPTKYQDFGIPEIELNAGVAGAGLLPVMGWAEVPGAAAGMVADVWVEFSWLAFPFLFLTGWGLGYAWRRAITQSGPWTSLFTIGVLLSAFLVSQSGEAVIFRLLILSTATLWVWRRAKRQTPNEAFLQAGPRALEAA
jgi:hypothetical protein